MTFYLLLKEYDEFDIQLQIDSLSAIVQRVHIGYTGNAEIMVKQNGQIGKCVKETVFEEMKFMTTEFGERLTEELRIGLRKSKLVRQI